MSIITYGHQIWTATAKSHISGIQRIRNKFLRIILNKSYDTNSIHEWYASAIIQTIQEYIVNLLESAHHTGHQNPLISQTEHYNVNNIPLKIKKKLRRSAISTS